MLATEIVANGTDFKVFVVTNDVPNARQMAESASGMLFVGTRRAGKLYAVCLLYTSDAADE